MVDWLTGPGKFRRGPTPARVNFRDGHSPLPGFHSIPFPGFLSFDDVITTHPLTGQKLRATEKEE